MPQPDQFAKVFANFDAEVQARVEEIQIQEGYIDADGEPSMRVVKEAVYEILTTECVVASKAERSKKALTRGELYFRIYPKGPGAGINSIDDLNTVERKVYETLADGVWDLTQGSRSGWLQKRLGDSEATLVLCRRKIHRPTEAMLAAYLTDNELLIREDAVDKLVASLLRRASVIRRDLDMVLTRHPALRGPIAAQLSGELKKIQAELTLPTLAAGDDSPSSRAELSQIPAGV
jgi:hypothetical protein